MTLRTLKSKIAALPKTLKITAVFGTISLLGLGVYLAVSSSRSASLELFQRKPLTKDKIKEVLADSVTFQRLPAELDFELQGESEKVHGVLEYAFDPKLQKQMEGLFRSYQPDYGAFVAMDATTGRVLSMVSFSRNPALKDNLALRATFPSASVFKVVTAAAAIEVRKYSANTVIPFNGRNHTLYRGQVLKNKITRWTRYITLKEAFARSVNTVFGRIGAFTVGPEEMRQYADRFGFNRQIASDMPVQQGNALIPDDSWGLAESSSGFTRENTMSPLQGALIAAAIANDGLMMEPYVVQSIRKTDGTLLYGVEPKIAAQAVDPSTAAEVRALMRETVTRGTSRGSFRGFFRHGFEFLNVGGKTGSLTGTEPRGKYDWFVGYAEGSSHRIAIAALTIHERLWRVKSSYLARKAIETYFQDRIPLRNMASERVLQRRGRQRN